MGQLVGLEVRLKRNLSCQKQNRVFENTTLSFPSCCGTKLSLCPSTGQGSFYSKSKYWRGLGPNATFFVNLHRWCDSESSEPSNPDQRRETWHLLQLGCGTTNAQGLEQFHLRCGCYVDTAPLPLKCPNELKIPKDRCCLQRYMPP